MVNFESWWKLSRSWRTETALIAGFIVLVAVIGISAGNSAMKLRHFADAAKKDRYYGFVVQELESVIADLTVAETYQRSFLVTANPNLLKSLNESLDTMTARFEGLAKFTRGTGELHEQVRELQQRAVKAVAFMKETVEYQKAGDMKRAWANLIKARHHLVPAVQVRLREVRREYMKGLGETTTHIEALRTDTLRSFLITAVLTTVVLALMGFVIVLEARSVRNLSHELLRESRHDSLTGLPNRAYLNETLERAILGAKRTGEKLGLLYMDLNGFKKINDTFGHKVGDDVLVEAARWFKSVARGADFVARLGGDEFAVVLPRMQSRGEVMMGAERFGKLEISRGEHKVTTSVGCAVYPDDGHTASALIRLSDAEMYERKQKSKRS